MRANLVDDDVAQRLAVEVDDAEGELLLALGEQVAHGEDKSMPSGTIKQGHNCFESALRAVGSGLAGIDGRAPALDWGRLPGPTPQPTPLKVMPGLPSGIGNLAGQSESPRTDAKLALPAKSPQAVFDWGRLPGPTPQSKALMKAGVLGIDSFTDDMADPSPVPGAQPSREGPRESVCGRVPGPAPQSNCFKNPEASARRDAKLGPGACAQPSRTTFPYAVPLAAASARRADKPGPGPCAQPSRMTFP
eukprot:CAMPEP_0203880232 /NCGR_PEP_ID=MMETSP0359-20131031/24629_1 /ASSEMBLY_ACC=CAM_ASM_000338 /TAXON_ID=268821 /ORGANISM="Scrippsiella Hangoei, Strain SHTV-5" /LENGTH=247 /DNA_ID=CAMNT_0050799815 /DNA_START=727 /DNA_END=1471 /DNA_ORIENTATION=-